MPETILTYLKNTKTLSFKELPFNEVDSLILSQFSYLKMDGMVPGPGDRDRAVTLFDIRCNDDYDRIYADERYRKNNTALFEAMLVSQRFDEMRIHSYVSETEAENESQFAAVTIELEDGPVYVAFRGTDESFIGWKEDLNLALSRPVPGQIKSVGYLARVAEYLPEYFRIGGHSKGGNLAVFSAMYADESLQKRITDIYNHDGPGFRNEIMDEDGYRAIKDRIRMTVPHSSLVGMLLVNFDDYRVVDSCNPGALQHDPFSWIVKDYDFKLEDSVKPGSEIMDRSINEWVMSLNETQITTFLDAVYDMMVASGVDDLNELKAEWTKVLPRIADAIKDIDPDTMDQLMVIMSALMETAGINHKAERDSRIWELKEFHKNFFAEVLPKIEESFSEIKPMVEKSLKQLKPVVEGSIEAIRPTVEKAVKYTENAMHKMREKDSDS